MRWLNKARICSAGDGGVVGGCCGQNVLFMHARILTLPRIFLQLKAEPKLQIDKKIR